MNVVRRLWPILIAIFVILPPLARAQGTGATTMDELLRELNREQPDEPAGDSDTEAAVTAPLAPELPQPLDAKSCKDCGSIFSGDSSDALGDLIRETLKLKTPDELAQYFACYDIGGYHENYRDFSLMIKAAADSFNVPAQALSCLIFRESRWDAGARSGSGATGAGQQVQENIDHINAKITRNGSEDQKQWQAYFKAVNARDPKLGALCNGDFKTKTNAACRVSSVGATAMYLREIDGIVQATTGLSSDGTKNMIETWVLLGAGHNAGTGTIQRALNAAKAQGLAPNKWGALVLRQVRIDLAKVYQRQVESGKLNTAALREKFKNDVEARIEEVTHHMETLRNCLSAGNTKPPSGTPQRECSRAKSPIKK